MVDDVKFKRETVIEANLVELKSTISKLEEEELLLKRHKGVLVASGRSLNEIVVNILRSYFGLDLKSEEAYIEDAIIYESSAIKFVVEIKGENGSLKREHIHQVDNHRERRNMDDSVMGC